MSEQITAAKSNPSYIEVEKDLEESEDQMKVVSIRAGRLLKLKHEIEALRKEALNGYAEELKEFKSACNHTNALLGELNGTRGNETG